MALDIHMTGAGSRRAVLKFTGRLDAQTFAAADASIDDVLRDFPLGATLVFDLAELSYISSAGLRSVFRARKLAREKGGRVALVNLQSQVQKVFDIVKAVPVSEVFSSEAELDAYLENVQKKTRANDDDDFNI